MSYVCSCAEFTDQKQAAKGMCSRGLRMITCRHSIGPGWPQYSYSQPLAPFFLLIFIPLKNCLTGLGLYRRELLRTGAYDGKFQVEDVKNHMGANKCFLPVAKNQLAHRGN